MTDNEYVMSDENISEMEMVEIEDMNMSNKTFANFSKTNSNVTVCKGGSTIKTDDRAVGDGKKTTSKNFSKTLFNVVQMFLPKTKSSQTVEKTPALVGNTEDYNFYELLPPNCAELRHCKRLATDVTCKEHSTFEDKSAAFKKKPEIVYTADVLSEISESSAANLCGAETLVAKELTANIGDTIEPLERLQNLMAEAKPLLFKMLDISPCEKVELRSAVPLNLLNQKPDIVNATSQSSSDDYFYHLISIMYEFGNTHNADHWLCSNCGYLKKRRSKTKVIKKLKL